MAENVYVSVPRFKQELGAQDGGSAVDDRDPSFLRLLESVSRGIDRECGREFFSRVGIRYCASGEHQLNLGADGLHYGVMPGFDIVSLSAVGIDQGAGTFAQPLVETTDYYLYDWNRPAHTPALFLINNRYSIVRTSFSPLPRGTRLTGVFGYSHELEAADTLAAAMIDTTGTTLTLTTGGEVGLGDTIVIDSEQMPVNAVSGKTVTVSRGLNGSTAATHLISATVNRRRYSRDIEEATVLQAVRFYRQKQSGGANPQGAEFGWTVNALFPAIRDMINRRTFPAGI